MPGRGFVLLAASEYPCMTIKEIMQYILVYILLFITQAPIPVRLDGTIIDSSRIILVTMSYCCGYGERYDCWWLCMVINIISVYQ